MTNYNDGKWHGWNGGECPVHPETLVNAKFSCGTECDGYRAGPWDWGDNPTKIVAFRVVKEYKGPREWWILWSPKGTLIGNFSKASAEDKNRTHYAGKGEIVHVREVLD